MKKIFTILCLMALTMGAQAQTTYYLPSGRTLNFEVGTGKKYMIYNSARAWFLTASSNTAYGVHKTSNADQMTEAALWEFEAGETSGTYKIKSVSTGAYAAGGTTLGTSPMEYVIAEYSGCPNKGGMASFNDDGTTTAAASIAASNKCVYIKANTGGNPYFNGTATAFSSTGAAHVYAIYEVEETKYSQEVNTTNFTYNANWASTLTAKSTPVVKVEIYANAGNLAGNVQGNHANSATKFVYFSGQDNPSTYKIIAPANYYLIGYRITRESGPATLTPNEGTLIKVSGSDGISGDTHVSYTVSGLSKATEATFTCAGTNNANIGRLVIYLGSDSEFGTVNYIINDEEGNELKTYQKDEVVGSEITTLPTEFQNTLFYSYSNENYTAADGLNATFTATLKSTAPFIPSTATNQAWYNLYIHPSDKHYPTYIANGTPNVTLPATMTDDETTQWAFIGNPYDGFKIINKAAGTSLVLGSEDAGNNDNNGGNTYATLNSAGTKTHETWTITASTHATNGFFIANGQNHKLNYRSTANLAYWTGGFGAGSTFVATKVPTLAELIPEAEVLLSELTAGANDVQIGYPTASALSTFQQVIADAQTATDEAAGLAALKAAMAAVKSPANTNYTPRTDVYYTITSGRGSMVYDSSHSGQVDNIYGNEFLWYTTSLDKTNANHQWGFIEVDGKYYMYNVGKKQFANVTQGGSYQENNGDKHTWMFSNSPSSVTLDAGEGNWVVAPNVRVRAHSEITNKEYAMSISTTYVGPVIAYDAVNDGGIPMTFAIATTTQNQAVTDAINALLEDLQPYRDALQEVIDKANTVTFGTGLGEYATSTDFTNALTTAESQVDPENTSATKESIIAARTALETAIAALTLNMPQANTFLRIKSVAQNGYVSSRTGMEVKPSLETEYNGQFAKLYTTTGSATADSTIWFYDGTHLLNYKTGLYTTGVQATELSANAGKGDEVAFSEATNGIGMYWIKPTSENYWFGGNPTLDKWSTPATSDNTRFQLEYVDELPITLRRTSNDTPYFATFSAPVPVRIEGATLCSVEVSESGKAINYTATTNTQLAAENGVLLTGESDAATATIITETVETVDYCLTGYSAAFAVETGDKTKLFLGRGSQSGNAGFYALGSAKTNGFKAYFVNSTTGEAKEGFDLVNANETTGVESIDNAQFAIDNAPVYNLQGQRVVKAQKGVFIQNGKKVVVK